MQQPNTRVDSEDVEDYVLLAGGEHPELVQELVEQLTDSCELLSESRGFFTYKCKSGQGNAFTLAITGVGPSATEIAFIEYLNCGARVFIRAGTSGSLSKEIARGSVVITTKALRFDGVSDLYVGRRLQAIADGKVVRMLEKSARRKGVEYRTGKTLSTSGFYAMGRATTTDKAVDGVAPGHNFEPKGLNILQELETTAQVLNVEMETATLLTLSRIYKAKSGSVCGISNYIPWDEGEQTSYTEPALRNAIIIAVDALNELCRSQTK